MAALALASGLAVAAAAPASAGAGYWSQTSCTEFNGNPNPRLDVWWWSETNGSIDYWTARWGQHNVASWILDRYAGLGYQCGQVGAVTGDAFTYYAGNGVYDKVQYFECGFIAYQFYPSFTYPLYYPWSTGCQT